MWSKWPSFMKILVITQNWHILVPQRKKKKYFVWYSCELDWISISDAILQKGFEQGILISLCLRFTVTVIFVRLSAFRFLHSLGNIFQQCVTQQLFLPCKRVQTYLCSPFSWESTAVHGRKMYGSLRSMKSVVWVGAHICMIPSVSPMMVCAILFKFPTQR